MHSVGNSNANSHENERSHRVCPNAWPVVNISLSSFLVCAGPHHSPGHLWRAAPLRPGHHVLAADGRGAGPGVSLSRPGQVVHAQPEDGALSRLAQLAKLLQQPAAGREHRRHHQPASCRHITDVSHLPSHSLPQQLSLSVDVKTYWNYVQNILTIRHINL